jgi:Fungal specific transcription factor domain
VTERISHGYAKHIVPLAIENDMVRNALLAASASQIGAHRKMRFQSLAYRSAAIRGLQQISKELQMHPESALFTLATILGLLIDDIINENKDFPALVKLADSCLAMSPFGNDQSQAPLRQFILNQIQMYDFCYSLQ